ncbi:signal peptidase I [Leucobacter sp. HY1910]
MINTIYTHFRSGVLTLAAVMGVLSIVVFLSAMFFGVKALNVMSGSMEPGIPTGSMIFTTKIDAKDITPGDVITTERTQGEGLITHRVLEISPVDGSPTAFEMRMRGDANATEDPQPYVITEADKYFFHAPFVGLVSSLLKTSTGLYVGVAVVALLLFIFIVPGKRRAETVEDATEKLEADTEATGQVTERKDSTPATV